MPQSLSPSSPPSNAGRTSEKTLAELMAAERSSRLTRVAAAPAAAKDLMQLLPAATDRHELLNFLQRRKAKQPLAFLQRLGESRSHRSARNSLRANLSSIPESRLQDVVDEYFELKARKVAFADTSAVRFISGNEKIEGRPGPDETEETRFDPGQGAPKPQFEATMRKKRVAYVESLFEQFRASAPDTDVFDRQIRGGGIPAEVADKFGNDLSEEDREAIIGALQKKSGHVTFLEAVGVLVESGPSPATEDDAMRFFKEVGQNPQDHQDPNTRKLAAMLAKVPENRYVDLYDEWQAEPARQKKLELLNKRFNRIRKSAFDVDRFDRRIAAGKIPDEVLGQFGKGTELSDRDTEVISVLLQRKLAETASYY
ncbi:MAG TPA: hypothetical protein VFP68_11860 [Burkholderiaceae bacterium]|nr:hypothetical protein [Burkholderiaceae bacterium]